MGEDATLILLLFADVRHGAAGTAVNPPSGKISLVRVSRGPKRRFNMQVIPKFDHTQDESGQFTRLDAAIITTEILVAGSATLRHSALGSPSSRLALDS